MLQGPIPARAIGPAPSHELAEFARNLRVESGTLAGASCAFFAEEIPPVARRGLTHSRRLTALALAALVLLVPSRFALGQDRVIPRITEPIVLDGHVRERVWLDLPPFPTTMFEPEFEGSITRRSTIRLAHPRTRSNSVERLTVHGVWHFTGGPASFR